MIQKMWNTDRETCNVCHFEPMRFVAWFEKSHRNYFEISPTARQRSPSRDDTGKESLLQLRNTLGKKIESFPTQEEILARPENSRFVSMYTCGPTVYDYASIGNFSAYLMADLVKRYLKYLGYPVKHVINITDVGHLTADADVTGEDKLEEAARKEGIDPTKIAEKYTAQFLADAKALGIEADVWPKATDHIPQMIALIEKLVEKDCAYVAESGVYFDVAKDPDYGQLSGNSIDQLKAGARVEVHPDKKHPADFALWKLGQPDHLQQWDSPWGKGYPGWHIECSAMSMQYLGNQIDIHTGGEDNIFPHHESEIAQSECATGARPFVHFWLHKQFMTVDGQKMSKSLGNTYRLQDMLDRGFEPEDFRMLVFGAHYRSGINFSWKALNGARERRLKWKHMAEISDQRSENTSQKEQFLLAMDDDLNTPQAFASIEQKFSQELLHIAESIFHLGLFTEEKNDADILKKVEQLDEARETKNFTKADSIRAEIVAAGYEVLTSPDGTKIRKK